MIPVELETKYFVRGDNFSELYVFYARTIMENGDEIDTPLDLTTFTSIRMDLRRGTNRRTDLIASFEVGENLTITGDNNEELSIDYPTSVTDKLQNGIYYRDIRFITGTTVATYLSGKIIIQENVTEL